MMQHELVQHAASATVTGEAGEELVRQPRAALLPSRPPGPVDLRAMFRAIGRFQPVHAAMTAPRPRTMWTGPVVSATGESEPIAHLDTVPAYFADGTQGHLLIDVRPDGRRPVYLDWAAAAVTDGERSAITCEERLYVAASHLDVTAYVTAGTGLPVCALDASLADGLAREAVDRLDACRRALERLVVDAVDLPYARYLVVDGSIRRLPATERTIGVIKSARTRFLADETPVVELPAGWRSAAFFVPARSRSELDTWSCYARLHDPKPQAAWFGLVRLEALTRELLDVGAAIAWQQRQPPGVADPRWDRHLRGVARTEEILNVLRPDVYQLAS